MVTLHAFLALAAGFLTMAVLVAALTALLVRLTPSWVSDHDKPQPGYIFVNLGYSFLAAAAGGYVTAWLAAANPLYQHRTSGCSLDWKEVVRMDYLPGGVQTGRELLEDVNPEPYIGWKRLALEHAVVFQEYETRYLCD